MLWYMHCVNVRDDSIHHRYTLWGLVPQNSGRVYVNLIFVECILVLPKFGGFHKNAIYIVGVNFVKI